MKKTKLTDLYFKHNIKKKKTKFPKDVRKNEDGNSDHLVTTTKSGKKKVNTRSSSGAKWRFENQVDYEDSRKPFRKTQESLKNLGLMWKKARKTNAAELLETDNSKTIKP